MANQVPFLHSLDPSVALLDKIIAPRQLYVSCLWLSSKQLIGEQHWRWIWSILLLLHWNKIKCPEVAPPMCSKFEFVRAESAKLATNRNVDASSECLVAVEWRRVEKYKYTIRRHQVFEANWKESNRFNRRTKVVACQESINHMA